MSKESIKEAKELSKIAEEHPELVQGSPMSVTITDTIVAQYAQLPILSPQLRYLVKVLTPVELVPMEMKFSFYIDSTSGKDHLTQMKERLLKDWHKQLKNSKKALKRAGATWMLEVNKVELIECDLLVPKSK